MALQDKIDYSINLLRRAEPMALRMSDKGYFLAFSGGKDSQCLYHIAKEAGVKFEAHYQLTPLDIGGVRRIPTEQERRGCRANPRCTSTARGYQPTSLWR